MFFLPRYPWGHCVQVTQSAWRINWMGVESDTEGGSKTSREPIA